MGTSGNFCFRGRDAENKLRHAALPDFATPRGNVKDSFDFFCLLHSPCPGQVLFILLEWDVWLEWGAASRPLFSQISSYCSLPSPALPYPCPCTAQGCSPQRPDSPTWHRGHQHAPMASWCPTLSWLGSQGTAE